MTSILDRPLKARTFPGLGRRRRAANHLATVLVTTAMLVALAPLLLVLYSVVAKGFTVVASTEWWTHSQAGMTAFVAGGGACHAVIGTLLQGSLCAVLAVPIGVMVAVYLVLVEYGGGTRCGRLTSFMVDILSGVPSIVAALFIYALCTVTLGLSRSGLALALALLMLPVIVRATEEVLRVVPVDLREASYALGIPKWKTIVRVVIPTGLSGIATGIMLAVARVMGETAPLLILVAYSQSMAYDIFGGFMGSLPGMIYDQASAGAGVNPFPTDRLWGAALTLILLIAVINLGARVIAKVFAPRSHRQEH